MKLKDARTTTITLALFAISQAASKIKEAASPYAMESDVKETLYRIPGDYEVRYMHKVEYYTPAGKKLNLTTTYYSMFI
ncbi:hypothetical protein [Anaerovorax odorimutans]|uniref:hypothetical protein n=1 Tax=Anaerovorax odorimutans TaxID=109327 RepID=UPI00041275A7|nr:hypothetical protein [Anaerovorax odorimutans]